MKTAGWALRQGFSESLRMSKSKRKSRARPDESPIQSGPRFDPDLKREYRRSAWKHYIRYTVFAVFVMLNLSMTMSFVERAQQHMLMGVGRELVFFVVLALLDLFMFVPIIFEVNRVETDADGILLTTLFWRKRLEWEEIRRFEAPRFLKFAIIRTERCFYLINKPDIPLFSDLARTLAAKIASSQESS